MLLTDLSTDPLYARLYRFPGCTLASPSGAVSAGNLAYEEGHAGAQLNIIEQAYGERAVCAGACGGNVAYADLGETALAWGTSQMAADGSFPSVDAYHQSYWFWWAHGRSLILAERSNPSLAKGLHHLIDPIVAAAGDKNDEPYGHRRWNKAACLSIAERLGVQNVLGDADQYALDALAIQNAAGYFPELGGFDTSYNGAGLAFALDYLATREDSLSISQTAISWSRIRDSIRKGLDWQLTRFAANGSAILVGDTRVYAGSPEAGPSGAEKTMDYRSSFVAMVGGWKLFADSRYQACAKAIAGHCGW